MNTATSTSFLKQQFTRNYKGEK